MKKLTYKQSGVNYDVMDPLKKMAQIEGEKTAQNLLKGLREVALSRGESAYVMQQGTSYIAFVQEGLGTKTLVADAMYTVTGKTYYDSLAQDTVAMIVNDLITVGAKPITIMAYWAAGSSTWFLDTKKMKDLVTGWRKACDISGAVWGGGETPTLPGIIEKKAIDLAGSCFGIIKEKKRLILGEKLAAGDAIILFESSGIHANGLSLARKLASQLPKGYRTRMTNGKMCGEELLIPTRIYVKLIGTLLDKNIDIHYMANITGHGWRKLMRHTKKLTYRIQRLPSVPLILQFIQEKAQLSDEEAYGNLNMGAGFAIFVPQTDIKKVLKIARQQGIAAYDSGVVQKGPRQVVIEPLGITFSQESLQVR